MSKIKVRLIRMVSLWDILIGSIISWVVKKLLDFLWGKGKIRLRFKGKTHFRIWSWLIIGPMYMRVYLPYIIGYNEAESEIITKTTIFTRMVKTTLGVHRLMHKYGAIKTESCQYCQVIAENKTFLQRFISSPKLYPPFNF